MMGFTWGIGLCMMTGDETRQAGAIIVAAAVVAAALFGKQ